MSKIKTFFMLSEEDKKQCSRKYFNITPDICICENFIVTLKSDGTVFVSGDKQFDIQDWINVIKICGGKNHVVGLKSDGTVVALGDNAYHQCDVSSWRNIVGISAKDNLTVGISSENITYTTGSFEKTDVEANNEKTMHEIFSLENKLRSMQNSMDTLQNSMITFSARQTNSEASIINTGKQIHQTIGTIVQEYEAKIADLKSQLDAIQDTVGKLLSNETGIQSDIINVQTKIDIFENTINQINQTIGTIVQGYEVKINGLKNKINTLENLIENMQNSKEIVHYSSRFEYLMEDDGIRLMHYVGADYDRLEIPNTVNGKMVRIIQNGCFDSTLVFDSIHIPENVTKIGTDEYRVFGKCKDLEWINVHENNSVYSSENGVLFNKSKTQLIFYPRARSDKNYSIPNGIIEIAYKAFENCKNLQNLSIPNSIECDLDIYNSIEDGDLAIDIPDYIWVGDDSYLLFFNDLAYCENLTKITVAPDNSYLSSSDGVLFDRDKRRLLMCPRKKQNYYIVPDTVVSIEHNAFYSCGLNKIFIPDSVERISRTNFKHMSDLVIWGNSGSYACEYAKEHDLKFMDKNKNRFLFNRYFGGNK